MRPEPRSSRSLSCVEVKVCIVHTDGREGGLVLCNCTQSNATTLSQSRFDHKASDTGTIH